MKYLDRFFQPEGWQEKTFRAPDGKNIRYGHIAAENPDGTGPKGTVIITTGYADFIESFHETIHDYKNRGYDVWIMDWAGQGGSDKKRDAAEPAMQLEDHIRHLHHFRHNIVMPVKDAPVIMSTHSLGGQIGLNYMNMYPKDFDLAIMAAPLVDFGLSPITRGVLKAIFRSAVTLGFKDQTLIGGRKHIQRSSQEQRKKIREQNPVRMELHRTFFLMNRQLGAEDPTVGLLDSLLDSTEKLNKERVLGSIKAPVLFAISGDDHIVNNDAIARAAKMMPNAKVVEFPGAVHSLWNERQHILDAFWREIDVFLEQHAKPAHVNDNKSKPPAPKGP